MRFGAGNSGLDVKIFTVEEVEVGFRPVEGGLSKTAFSFFNLSSLRQVYQPLVGKLNLSKLSFNLFNPLNPFNYLIFGWQAQPL